MTIVRMYSSKGSLEATDIYDGPADASFESPRYIIMIVVLRLVEAYYGRQRRAHV